MVKDAMMTNEAGMRTTAMDGNRRIEGGVTTGPRRSPVGTLRAVRRLLFIWATLLAILAGTPTTSLAQGAPKWPWQVPGHPQQVSAMAFSPSELNPDSVPSDNFTPHDPPHNSPLQEPPAVLWQLSGVYLYDHNLVNRTVRGPFDFPAAVTGSTGRIEWHNEHNSADYSFIEFANLTSHWSFGMFQAVGEGFAWHQVRRRFNYWAGGGAYASPSVYIRALPNGQRPSYRVEVAYEVDLWAEATRSAWAAGPAPLSPRVASQPNGIPRIAGTYHFLLNDRNALRGPITLSEYPSAKYYYLNLWQFITDTEVGLGYPFEAVTDQSSARLTYTASAYINEGVPPIAQLEEPNGSPVVIMPGQIGPPLRFVSSSYDPDNPGQDPLRGIIRHEWSFEREDGSVGKLTGPQISLSWSKEGTYWVKLTVIDDEFMRASTEVLVIVKGPEPIVMRAAALRGGKYVLDVWYWVRPSKGSLADMAKHIVIYEAVRDNRSPTGGCPEGWAQIDLPWVKRCIRREKIFQMWPGAGTFAVPVPHLGWRGMFGDGHGPWAPNYIDLANLTNGDHFLDQRYVFWAPWLRVSFEDVWSWPNVSGDATHVINRKIYSRDGSWWHEVQKGSDSVLDRIVED